MFDVQSLENKDEFGQWLVRANRAYARRDKLSGEKNFLLACNISRKYSMEIYRNLIKDQAR